MPAIHKGSPKIKFQFVASKRQSVLGGLPAIEALAQEFDLWRKLRQLLLQTLRALNPKGLQLLHGISIVHQEGQVQGYANPSFTL